jgi:hypothetical protein
MDIVDFKLRLDFNRFLQIWRSWVGVEATYVSHYLSAGRQHAPVHHNSDHWPTIQEEQFSRPNSNIHTQNTRQLHNRCHGCGHYLSSSKFCSTNVKSVFGFCNILSEPITICSLQLKVPVDLILIGIFNSILMKFSIR